jgi:PKD repeat protein
VTLVVEPDPSPLPDPDDPPGDPEPENVSPVVVLTYASGQFAGQPYIFSTADTDANIAGYTMDWGDDTEPDTDVLLPDTLTHTYATAGTYTATLTVTDVGSPALSGSASRTVTIQSSVVANQAPICSVTRVSGFYVGDFTFALTASDADGVIGSYSITHGDGTSSGTIAGSPPATYTHTYGTAHASRTLTLTVSDGSVATSRSVTFAVLARPAPVGGAHAYFESLQALPEHHASWGLRSQSELDDLVNAPPSSYFTFSPSTDSYPQAQDGAKFYKPVDDRLGFGSDSIPGNQQLKMPIGINTGTILICWDFWYGEEFRLYTRAGDPLAKLANYKTFQVRQGVSGRWWTVKDHFFRADADPEISKITSTLDRNGLPLPPGCSSNDPLEPTGEGAAPRESYPILHSRWTRRWIEIRLNRPAAEFTEWKALAVEGPTGNSADLTGTWHMLSLWVADEGREAARTLFRVPWQMGGTQSNSTVGSFDFEFNTSCNPPPCQTGPLIGYGRNVVVLHNYALPTVDPEADADIFQKPSA